MEVRELDGVILGALEPRSWRERVSARLQGGLSAIQVVDRLPVEAREALEREAGSEVLGRRRAVDVVAARLRELEREGRVVKARARLATDVRVKGIRIIEVDVFRRA